MREQNQPPPRDLLQALRSASAEVAASTERRNELIRETWLADCTLRDIADAAEVSHMTVKRLIDLARKEGGANMIKDTWSQYESRYSSRPETYAAYVDVWNRVPTSRDAFTGWVSFGQAANAEPAQSGDRVRAAEEFMRLGGYKLGPLTSRGARRWFKE